MVALGHAAHVVRTIEGDTATYAWETGGPPDACPSQDSAQVYTAMAAAVDAAAQTALQVEPASMAGMDDEVVTALVDGLVRVVSEGDAGIATSLLQIMASVRFVSRP